MAKKTTNLGQTGLAGTLFTNINPYEQPEKEPGPFASATTIPTSEIQPDPNQPRQLLPGDLARRITEDQLTPNQAMAEWLSIPDSKTNSELENLKKLAGSIEQHGLINPITIRPKEPEDTTPPNTKYIIVTGERRYWAHIYLAHNKKEIREGEETQNPDHIKAGIINKGISIRAHQLLENILREDINAVEKARGFLALRYELSGVNHGSPSPGTSDSALVPWSKVEQSLGISKRYRTYITAVLNLCDEALSLIAEHNLRERMIRPITQKLKPYPELQVAALKQLAAWQTEPDSEEGQSSSVTAAVENLANSLLEQQQATGKTKVVTMPQQKKTATLQFHRKIRGTLRLLDKLNDIDLSALTQELTVAENADIVSEIRDLKEQLDTLLAAVSKDKF